MPSRTRDPISSIRCPAASKLTLLISTLTAEWPPKPAINMDMPPVHCGCTGVQVTAPRGGHACGSPGPDRGQRA
eukprot:19594-Chlamydomonas_euryale.AAC.1